MARLRAFCCRWLVPLALVAMVAMPAFAAVGDDELLLWRGQVRGNGDTVDFFVRGARPGEIVFFLLCEQQTLESASQAIFQKPVIADAAGGAFLQIPRPESAGGEEEQFFVCARVDRDSTRRLWSNFEQLSDAPALYLCVEGADGSSHVLTFDPRNGALNDSFAMPHDPAPLLAAPARTAVVRRDHSLVAIDGSTSFDFGPLEEPACVAATPDGSALLVVTREQLPGGRALLRLRLRDAKKLESEIGSLEVLRGSRVIGARLVMPEDARRALLVSDSGGLIREVTLGVEPGRGMTFLPLAPDNSDELVDVRVTEDWLVAITRAKTPRGDDDSRMLLLDLRTRAEPTVWPLPSRALHFELGTSGEAPVAVVTLADGRVEAIRLDDPLRGRSDVRLPAADRLARSPLPSRLYVLSSQPGAARVYELDLDTLELTQLPFADLAGSIEQFDVFGAPEAHWLYVVEKLLADRERLWCCRLDPGSGWPMEQPTSHLLPGHVLRTAAR